MKYIVLVLTLLFGLSPTAEAQHWGETPVYALTAADKAQLPFSVTFNWEVPAPWNAVNTATWDPVWPRDAAGAWYRPTAYTQATIWRNKLYSRPYNCSVSGLGFRCFDSLAGAYRTITCPATIAIGPLWKWRSAFYAAWWQKGLFWGSEGPFSCTTGRTLPLQAAYVTDSGQRVNCQYGPATIEGPKLASDVWCFRRPGT